MNRAERRHRTQCWIDWRLRVCFKWWRWQAYRNLWYLEPNRLNKNNMNDVPPHYKGADEAKAMVDRHYQEGTYGWHLGQLRKHNRIFRRYVPARGRRGGGGNGAYKNSGR